MKSEIFNKILQIVSEETEIYSDFILSTNRTADILAARSIFVNQCTKAGLPVVAIIQFIGRKKMECIANYNTICYTLRSTSPYYRKIIRTIEERLSLIIQ